MDIRDVRVAVVPDDGVARAAYPLAHVAAHLAEADETELHQLCSLGRWGVCGTLVPPYEPNPTGLCTAVGIRAQTWRLTCGFRAAAVPVTHRGGPAPCTPVDDVSR
ncbi:hypothetical protein GCM10010335_38240 [Streptomyces galbus]|nr:hypothetical protein GCM10010335_38240 [Streptomyces galbus]